MKKTEATLNIHKQVLDDSRGVSSSLRLLLSTFSYPTTRKLYSSSISELEFELLEEASRVARKLSINSANLVDECVTKLNGD